jgi:hypothetical protein
MPFNYAEWTDTELDDAIVKLCEEFPDARMSDLSRTLEHCRRTTPRGSPESLLAAMRAALRQGVPSSRAVCVEVG